MRRMSLLLAFVILTLTAFPARAFIGGAEVPSADTRFDAVGGFGLAEQILLPGVFGTVVLVAPDRVLMPRHLINENYFVPFSVDQDPRLFFIRFRRREDGRIGVVDDPESFFYVGIRGYIFQKDRGREADVMIAVLDRPVTHIRPVTLDDSVRVAAGTDLTVVSWGPQARGSTSPNSPEAAGRMRSGPQRVKAVTRLRFDLTPQNEARAGERLIEVVRNDSGAAAFVASGNRQVFVGFIATTTDGVQVKPFINNRSFFPLPRVRIATTPPRAEPPPAAEPPPNPNTRPRPIVVPRQRRTTQAR